MSKTLNFLRAGAVALLVAAPVVAEESPSANTVLVTVDGSDITLGMVIAVREALPDQYKELGDDVLFDSILDQLIQQTALAATLDGEVSRKIELTLENEKRALQANEALENFMSVSEISDEELQALYDEQFAHLADESEYNASHILVNTEEEALALVLELEDGADFAELAQAKSTGPSGPSGGALGWFGKGQMVQPFEAAVVDMAVGAVSAPVQTQFGWHVIKLNDTRQVQAPSFEETRGELLNKAQEEAARAYIADLTAGADIVKTEAADMSPEIIRRADLIGGQVTQD